MVLNRKGRVSRFDKKESFLKWGTPVKMYHAIPNVIEWGANLPSNTITGIREKRDLKFLENIKKSSPELLKETIPHNPQITRMLTDPAVYPQELRGKIDYALETIQSRHARVKAGKEKPYDKEDAFKTMGLTQRVTQGELDILVKLEAERKRISYELGRELLDLGRAIEHGISSKETIRKMENIRLHNKELYEETKGLYQQMIRFSGLYKKFATEVILINNNLNSFAGTAQDYKSGKNLGEFN